MGRFFFFTLWLLLLLPFGCAWTSVEKMETHVDVVIECPMHHGHGSRAERETSPAEKKHENIGVPAGPQHTDQQSQTWAEVARLEATKPRETVTSSASATKQRPIFRWVEIPVDLEPGRGAVDASDSATTSSAAAAGGEILFRAMEEE